MVKGILGKKLGMLQMWSKEEKVLPVTAVLAGPCPVVQVKTSEKDGYNSIQIGFSQKKEKSLAKAEKGHQKKSYQKQKKYVGVLTELKDFFEEKQVGDVITCKIFKPGDKVFVRGRSKGKGFQGVVKRHGFSGGRSSHGSHFHRAPGSIGAGTSPGEVAKGKKMPGRMGAKNVNIKNIEIVDIVPEENMIFLKGSVAGNSNSIIYIYQKHDNENSDPQKKQG